MCIRDSIYRDEAEVLMAYNEHIIGIHQPVWVRVTKELNGEKVSHVVRATAGRIIFNRNIPQDLGFVKRFNEDGTPSDKFFDYEITETCGKKLLGKIVGAIRLPKRSGRYLITNGATASISEHLLLTAM